jgi:hypothetical protein
VANERKMIGNEAQGGTRALAPTVHRANQRLISDFQVMRERRQQLIDIAAAPPRFPVPAKMVPAIVSNNPSFNQIAYSVLLISVLGVISIGTNYINWSFLVYGVLAVLIRLPSSQMFVASIISLILIPITTALQRNTLANTFSLMTFYFLFIGLVRTGLELYRAGKSKA